MSINVNDKNLGHATAYAYYKAGGGTMTEAEFTEFMADFGTASQTAVEAAQEALASKNAAQTAATTATNKASEATTAAATATTKAGEASTSASTATSAKDTAVSASQTATSKASEATTAAATATSAATTATTAKDDAVSAKTAAQTAQTGAETAAASVAGSAAQIQTNAEDISQLKSDFDSITEESDEYTNVTPLSTVTGKYVFNNTYNNKLNEASDASMSYKVFPVFPGKYKIYGFGYDRYQFYMAVIGDNSEIMDGSTAISNFIQNIECGGSEYPGDFTYHSVEITLNVTGYLFVNYKNAQAEGTCGVAKIVPITDPAIKSSINNVTESSGLHGLIKTGSDYYHFTPYKDKYLFRKFKQMGSNNLFQWAGIYIGTFDENEINITTTIINYDTDIIGPITIFNTTLWPGVYGKWSGGNHTITIDGTAYPTAKQDSIKVLVNGAVVTDDGVYYGDAKIITVNSLYFPQSITGADLANATKAIVETREYSLDKQLKVRVKLAFVETTRVSLYYGMQAVIAPYQDILFANNAFYGALPSNENRNFAQKEHEVILNAENGLRLIVALSDIGLGTFSQNDGSTGYATLPPASVTRKLYYRLIDGASSHGYENGDVLMWEGEYSIEQV